MKRFLLLFAVLALAATLISSSRAADGASGISIEDALKIAENYLKSTSPSEPRSIVALTLETTTSVRGANYWYAKWSSPILSSGKPQLGLRIEMDGSLTKVVSANREPGNVVPGVGQQKFGARNIR